MNRLKKTLQGWPFLYRVARKTYHSLRRVLETRLLGTRLQEWTASRGRGYGAEAQDMGQWSEQPHRRLLVEKILAYAPLETVLEIGCSSGPNLYLLASTLPPVQVFGIDLNRKDIERGGGILPAKQDGQRTSFLRPG